MIEVPETRFARLGEDRIAYQVFGDGPVDLLWVIGLFETLDGRWEWPPYAHFLRRVGSFCRVITFDRRGSGASDRASHAGLPVWEEWVDDARAVLDAVGSEQAAVYASSDAGPIGILFAATEPARTRALVLYCASARLEADDDYAFALSSQQLDDTYAYITDIFGTEDIAVTGPRWSVQLL
jgi:pimeloyl-ACP methyl ester carboxylesterase